MGFFSKLFGREKRPEIKVPSGAELFQQALAAAQGAFPQGFAAREQAAGQLQGLDISSLLAPVDAAQFGPTSFEEALGAQQFQNIFPDVQRQIRQSLSLSGFATSPILAQLEGRERGRLGVDIGSFLSNLGQRRAELEQQRRGTETQATLNKIQLGLGAAPEGLLGQIFQGQQRQAGLQQAEQLAQFQERASQRGGGSALLSLLGAGAGFALGGPVGAGIGGSLGGGIGSLFGGGSSPVGIQDALLLSQLGQGGGGGFFSGRGGGGGGLGQSGFTAQNFGNIFRGGGGLGQTLSVG